MDIDREHHVDFERDLYVDRVKTKHAAILALERYNSDHRWWRIISPDRTDGWRVTSIDMRQMAEFLLQVADEIDERKEKNHENKFAFY